MSTINIPDFAGASTAVQLPNANGRASAANSRPAALSTEDLAAINALATSLGALADTAWASGSGSLISLLKTIAGAALDVTTASPIKVVGNDEYETVAASQTDQVLGATGAIGDRLSHVLIIPATTAAGAVSIKDGAGSAITIFAGGGTTALTTLIPFAVPLGLKSLAGAWKITTGASVSAIACGDFS